jgi:hypothetical protein
MPLQTFLSSMTDYYATKKLFFIQSFWGQFQPVLGDNFKWPDRTNSLYYCHLIKRGLKDLWRFMIWRLKK